MAKCMLNVVDHETVIRVSDRESMRLLKTGLWDYTSKGKWKSAGRPKLVRDGIVTPEKVVHLPVAE